jgi:ubiquinone/menaquinone biosynthesis C-methylase UbiE
MLRSARRSLARHQTVEGFLIRHDADTISSDILNQQTRLRNVDIVICSFGFSAMQDWKIAFHRSFDLLKPGGIYLILDVYAQKRTFRSWLVESLTGSVFSRETWHFLEHLCPDFQMEYIDPSAHLFGGRVFVAFGTKP